MSYALAEGSTRHREDTSTEGKILNGLTNIGALHTTRAFQQEIFWASDQKFTDFH